MCHQIPMAFSHQHMKIISTQMPHGKMQDDEQYQWGGNASEPLQGAVPLIQANLVEGGVIHPLVPFSGVSACHAPVGEEREARK